MLVRDQVTQDASYRPWATYDEVEMGALLIELSASLRRRMATLEVDKDTALAYRTLARTSRTAGYALIFKHGMPFVPTPPFQWSKLRIEQVNERLPEIQEWASATVVAPDQTLPVRHSALDLSEAGRELERYLQRERSK
ncbi:MAG TPA: hypothetical protein VD969_14580 [Symbiobacteriaceae bacterium]|nr:hypothetical protein [Symbiobacteriaceae bacterium]